MKFEAVIFDLGGTLIEYENHDWDELGRRGFLNAYPVLKDVYPSLPPADEIGPLFGAAMRRLLDEERPDFRELELHDLAAQSLADLSISSADGLIERFVENYYRPITEQITLIDNAAEVLASVKDGGIRIGLLSNTIFPEKFHKLELARFGLIDYFDFTGFSSTLGIRKPAPAIFEVARRSADCPADRILFVGDRPDIDIVGAAAAGFATVWKYHPRREYRVAIKPDYSIVKLNEIETILFS